MPTTILVVEDEPLLQIALATALSAQEYGLVAAHNLAEASAHFDGQPPDIVLLDIDLADGSGMSVLSRARALSGAPPVIITTGSASADAVIGALRQGAFDYLTKPINLELLQVILECALEQRRLEEAARTLARYRAYDEVVQKTSRMAMHHLSQCLTIIMGEAQMLEEDLADNEARAGLERIIAATERAAKTLTDLRHARHLATQAGSAAEPLLDDGITAPPAW